MGNIGPGVVTSSFTSAPKALLCSPRHYLKSSPLMRPRMNVIFPSGTNSEIDSASGTNGVAECAVDDEGCLDEKKKNKKNQLQVDGLEP